MGLVSPLTKRNLLSSLTASHLEGPDQGWPRGIGGGFILSWTALWLCGVLFCCSRSPDRVVVEWLLPSRTDKRRGFTVMKSSTCPALTRPSVSSPDNLHPSHSKAFHVSNCARPSNLGHFHSLLIFGLRRAKPGKLQLCFRGWSVKMVIGRGSDASGSPALQVCLVVETKQEIFVCCLCL